MQQCAAVCSIATIIMERHKSVTRSIDPQIVISGKQETGVCDGSDYHNNRKNEYTMLHVVSL